MFSKEELERYSRHLIIPEFNISAQRKLKESKVLVVGTGGLGAPLIQYLAAAGVGTLGIVDFDVIEDSNLQRQVLFTTSDVGRSKVEVAAERVRAQNPFIEVKTYPVYLNESNALDIIKDYDVVADGTDNFPTRYLVNDACVILNKVNVYASIFRFEGQLSVFNYPLGDKRSAHYRHLFPEPPPPGLVPSCAEGGVLGVLPGILGALQANEVIKVITGVGIPLYNKLFLFDASTFETRTLNIEAREEIKISHLQAITWQCEIGDSNQNIKSLTVHELKKIIENKQPFQLIDVRETFEYEISNLGGKLIPLGKILDHLKEFDKEIPVIVHCRSGKRSADAIGLLQSATGNTNLYNLEGGILKWAEEIDTSLAKY